MTHLFLGVEQNFGQTEVGVQVEFAAVAVAIARFAGSVRKAEALSLDMGLVCRIWMRDPGCSDHWHCSTLTPG